MDKEEALIDFLKGLRIVLNNASAYSKDHPYFRKSVETFKHKMDTLFPFLSPIIIDVTPDSLFIDARYWQKTMTYVELAQLFHLRKIKGIAFREGLTTEELIDFLSKVSLPIKEFFRQGGFKNILNNAKTPHLSIEELDYSRLLLDAGEESCDIWVYLFKEAIEKEDLAKVNEFADNFEKITAKFKAKDLCEDEEFRQSISNFLTYLRDKEKDKFYHCSKALLKFVLADKGVLAESEFNQIKIFFKDLSKEDLTEALLETIAKDDSYNYLSFQVFHKLFDEDTHKEVAPLLEKRIKNAEFIKTNPKIIKRIKELFSAPEHTFISPFYRSVLSRLGEENLLEEGESFDRQLLEVNYRFLLLNLLAQEQNRETSSLISERLLKECKKIIEERDLVFLKFIWEVLDKKIKEDASSAHIVEGLEKCISDFVENATFEVQVPAGLEYFTGRLRKSSLGFNFYLDNIFNKGKVNPEALKLLFRFFPIDLPYVYENLEKKHSDIDLLAKIVQNLEKVDSFLSLEMLKRIFYFSNNIIKTEVLRAMQGLSISDEEFLFSILKKEDAFLQKEAMAILAKNEATRRPALETYLYLSSPWGRKNKVLIERLRLIGALGLKEARGYLERLSKRRFFWNKNLREKASEVLKNWNVREN